MKSVKRHQFEAVSLLTTQNGLLNITVIPIEGQPNWLVPSSLILEINDFDEYIWTYLWRDQAVPVYHLLPKEIPPSKIIVLEGISPVHRIALQTVGDISTNQCRISEMLDTPLPEKYVNLGQDSDIYQPRVEFDSGRIGIPFIYQAVTLEGELYIVPDIEMIAFNLVDLAG